MLDRDGNFDLTDFVGDEIPKGWKRFRQTIRTRLGFGHRHGRAGIETGLAIAPSVDLPHGKIILHGPVGVERTIPVDDQGFFYINWQLTATNAKHSACAD